MSFQKGYDFVYSLIAGKGQFLYQFHAALLEIHKENGTSIVGKVKISLICKHLVCIKSGRKEVMKKSTVY